MLGQLKGRKIKSATIVETIIALLILMVSFSAGMLIYNNMLGSGVNDQQMRAEMDAEIVADSLSRLDNREGQVLSRSGLTYEISYKADERYPNVTVMSVICRDSAKMQLAGNLRLIQSDANGKD